MPNTRMNNGGRSTVQERQENLNDRIAKLETFLQQGLHDIKTQISPAMWTEPAQLAGTLTHFESKFLAEVNLIKSELIKQLTKLTKLIDNQQKEIEYMRKDKRSKFLVFNGIEEKEKEDICAIVVKIIHQKFKITIDVNNLDNCYRMGKKRPTDKKPRPVAVEFVNKWMKTQVFRVKKCLKGSGIVLSEMLTKENRGLYLKVRETVGARNCWTFQESGVKSLHIAFLNVRSLLPHFAEIKSLLIQENYDILGVSETWLTTDVTKNQIQIAGYTFIRADRATRGGGVGDELEQS